MSQMQTRMGNKKHTTLRHLPKLPNQNPEDRRMTLEKKIQEETIPRRVKTTWGNAQYIGSYRSMKEGYFYVYRLEKLQGTCQFVEFPTKEMRECIIGDLDAN